MYWIVHEMLQLEHYMLGLASARFRHDLVQAKAYMLITNDDRHPLFVVNDDKILMKLYDNL